MRIEQLDLLAFGPFSGTRLDFGAAPQALQLVYGPNEAGKSTTLRALVALLYGIPERTTDAHLHEMGKLRLAARLSAKDGTRLSIVRRKGRKQTLLDERERPLDESTLRALLGGLDETLYRQMFGLDHERLRLGAEALLQGGGGLGEGLFDAGTGARSIHAALTSLKDEADALYRPKGQRKLNVALSLLREKQRERKDAMLSPQAFEEQKRALLDAESIREDKRRTQAALLAEQARLELSLRALPLLATRDQLDVQRSVLGDVLQVSAELLAHAKDLERQRTQLLAEVSRLSAQRQEALRLQSELAPEETTVSLELARELTERLGNQRTAERELPRLRGELRTLQLDIASIRARMGQALEGAQALDAARRARLRKVAEELRALDAELSRARLQERAAQQQHELARERVLALGEPLPVEALRAHVQSKDHTQLEAEIARLSAQLQRQRASIERGLAQLGLTHSIATLARLSLPGMAEVDALNEGLEALQRRRQHLLDNVQETAQQHAALAQEIALLSAEGEPVTEDDLTEARSVRERFWSALSADFRAGTAPVAVDRLRAFEASQRASDRVADRLRSESGRSGLLAQQRARLQAIEAAQAMLESAQAELDRELTDQHARFVALWQAIGLAQRAPRDVAAARERLRVLVQLAEEHEQTHAEHERVCTLESAWRDALTQLIASVLGANAVTPKTLSERIAYAVQCLDRESSRIADRKVMLSEQRAAERALELQQTELSSLTQRAQELRRELAPELIALGLDADLSAHETLACLHELLQLEARERDRDRLERDIASLEAESAAFTREVHEIASAHLQNAASLSPAERVSALSERAQRARDLARDRERLTQELAALSALLSGVQAELANYERALQDLLSGLSVADVPRLIELEQKHARARELLEQREKIDADLLMHGAGASLSELEVLARQVEPSQARARLHEISSERELLAEQIRDADQEIGRVSAGLDRLKLSSGASESAEEVEAALSSVQQNVRRYVEVRLALAILTREVERYREDHQAPVLSRAAQLFPRLTLGRYRGLEADYADDDTPRLCALRDDSVRVHVAGLSDGTRDQLYLSLRIASIERFIERNPALPIVLDDILVHFDDARSEAALLVLGELAQRTQVLFFTHHARIVELAQRALPKAQLHVHTLRDPRSPMAHSRDDGPLFARV